MFQLMPFAIHATGIGIVDLRPELMGSIPPLDGLAMCQGDVG